MASSTLQKLLRNRNLPSSTLLAHFRKPLSQSVPFAPTQIPKPNHPIPDQPETDLFNAKHAFCGQVYPSFSFEFLLNPVSPLFIRPESDGEDNERNIIRADSVKKKRKKKMNKHKLKKLRKRLRRKT